MTRIFIAVLLAVSGFIAFHAPAYSADPEPQPEIQPGPLVIGETFTLHSVILDETRRINVFKPSYYGEPITNPLPVMYMPDGGIHEDFMHIAGLLDVGFVNGTLRPFLLVGIENTERARDMTGPTSDPEDKAIAERVGESDRFRAFIRTELMPAIDERYDTTDETAVIGESLAGLFVVETLLREPNLFDTYIAVDPSLWWNNESLVEISQKRFQEPLFAGKSLFLAASDTETIKEPAAELAGIIKRLQPEGLKLEYHPYPQEKHHSVYHPAAFDATRLLISAEAK